MSVPISTCEACGEEQTISQPDYELTIYCNRCAQLLVPILKEACLEALRYLICNSMTAAEKRVAKKITEAIVATEAGDPSR